MHEIHIKKLGPLDECRLKIQQFNVFTGPQSNGKSTIAKAIYYCRSIKQDILTVMMQGGPAKILPSHATWKSIMQLRMKEKFLQIFGTSWIMPIDMAVDYIYGNENMQLHISLSEVPNHDGRNFININFSDGFIELFEDLDMYSFTSITPNQRDTWERKLSKSLADPYDTFFIPAGRNLITLLSEQLNYIFTSLEGSQLRQIDYITKRFIETILRLKPSFADGIDGYIANIAAHSDIDAFKKYKNNKPVINLLLPRVQEILGGQYCYVDGEERLYISPQKYIKINFASSGQQEIIWVFNLLFYFLIEDKKVFLILEEPESHLYPESQRAIGEILGLFLNNGKNAELITTHSPYLLGTFNYMLQAGQCSEFSAQEIKHKLRKRYWLDPSAVSASYIINGHIEDAIDNSDNFTLIKNELIDQASVDINEISDYILEQNFEVTGDDEYQ